MGATAVYSTLLANAGMSAEQYGLEIARGADARAVMAQLVRTYNFPRGQAHYIPKLSPFSAASAWTRGSTEGDAATATTISDTKVTMTSTFAYSLVQLPWASQAQLDPARAQMTLAALRTNMEAAIAKKVDSTLLALYSGLSQTVGDNSSDISWANFAAAVELLEEASAPRPYFCVMHPKQYAKTFGIEEFVKSSVVADLASNAPLRTGANLQPLGVQIFFSSNVTDSSGLHNLVFSGEAFGLARTVELRVVEQADPPTLSDYIAAYHDFSVAEVFDTYAVDLITNNA